ncbi:hypothetical protein PPTG_21770 [Phytophthora nicotianae INRA-310]|uniref:Ubiquitin-like protease family profile domain-containing protein n=1 Tax=Phytophthora nicotianae (strain INRA-310) TaxID=761204 RepID=W2QW97_PHYN3|nr:hypothetical protein PPTG_21770 [Phytophthora nicotianae INRA-310]ETN16739.1 hypothetical protein PPTG_21770 [Phytophthora nicotianae INRA-310]
MMVGLYRDVATETLQMQVFMYEPFIDEEYRGQMIALWEGTMKHKGKNDVEESEGKRITISPVKWIETPQQPDAVSCDIFVVAQAYSYLLEISHFEDRSISMYHADKTHQIHELLQKRLG